MEADINKNGKELLPSWFLTVFHISQYRNYQKFDAYAL